MEKREKLIVMPLTPAQGQEYNGIGLGIHFFLGNIMAVQDKLMEFWFGWRVNKLFNSTDQLHAYCQGKTPDFDIGAAGEEQGIRYWLSGEYKQEKDSVSIALKLTDTTTMNTEYGSFNMDVNNAFSAFFKTFFSWIDKCGLPFSTQQASIASWPENTGLLGLDLLGRAVETTYISYVDGSGADSLISTENYEKSIAASPDSFLAHDLYAWALYKNKDYDQAVAAFNTALFYNVNGFGAVAGLMWCAVAKENRENALKHALTKAGLRNEDPQKARSFVAKKFETTG